MDVMRKNQVRLALGIVLLVAAGLRLYGLDWDEGQHAHPDERWIAMVAPSMTWPDRASDLLDPRRSTLNPLWVPDGQGGGQVRNFAYGHLPLYLQSLVGHMLAFVGQEMSRWGPRYQQVALELQAYGEYGGISLVGRALSVLFDLGTIGLVYLLGKRVYGGRAGLLGAALVAVAVIHIQLSHFATFDVMTTFFITFSVYGAVCVAQAEGSSGWPAAWSGALAGLAVASKFSALPLVAVLVVAQIVRAARHTDLQQRHALIRVLRRSLPYVLLSLLVALLAFFVASPFAILDFKLYLRQVLEQGAMVRGKADWPFTRQYRNTLPFVYQINQQVRWGLWWPLGIAAFAGFGWVLLRQFRRGGIPWLDRPRAEELVLLSWTVPYFLLIGTFMVKFMRYMLPLLPFMVLMGAAMMVRMANGEWRMANGEWRMANRKRATKVAQIATRNTQHATRNTQHAIRNTQHAIRHLLSAIPVAIPKLVLVASTLYALAFAWVYAQEHPWIQASQWIYAHVPDGSVIAVEHWDDHLPLSLPIDRANPGAHQYTHVELPMYEPDGPAKYDLIRARLREADYVVFSTNRLYRTIPRLPERYPLSAEFYRLFFEEKLGYVREKAFTAYPGLLGLQIRDDRADESFTVYDHPKPIVFRKTRDLGNLEWDARFKEALAQQPVWEYDAQKRGLLAFLDREPPEEGETERTLLLDVPVGDLPVVDDFGWNRWVSGSTVGATLLWWLVVGILGWLAWPIVFAVFSGLRDRGYLLSRSVALLIVGYLVWLPSSLRWLKNGLPLTGAAIGVMALGSGLLLWRIKSAMRAFIRHRWRVILLGEAVFGLAFLMFVGVRVLNPDLWHPWNGGEKGMDIAYLNACMRSAYAPPYDPYYSDGYLNYYYYGQFLISIVTRLTGLTTTVAFNLAVPLYFALTVCHAFAIGYTLAGLKKPDFALKRGSLGSEKTSTDVLSPREGARNRVPGAGRTGYGIGHGLLAVLCVTVLGNLASATQVIERLGNASPDSFTFTSQIPGLQAVARAVAGMGQILFHGARFSGFNYWDPSRVIAYTINEFPYWSFLFADLHPHMMNIPFTLLVLALALNWLRRERAPVRSNLSIGNGTSLPGGELGLFKSSFRYLWRTLDWGEVLNWVLWPLALGALAMINTWDLPAYAGFSGLVLLFVWVRARGRQGIVPALLAGIALTAGGVMLCAPFFQYYTAIHVGLGWSLGRTRTDPGEFLTVWGFLLFVAVSLLFFVWGRQRVRWGILRLIRIAVRHLSRLHRVEALYGMLVRQPTLAYRLSLWGAGLFVLALIVLAWKGNWVLVLMAPLVMLAAALMAQARMSDEQRFVLALAFTAFAIIVGVELFYLKDFLDGLEGWWRMNTLFKFYLQVWVMLGVAAGASLPGLWKAAGRWKVGWRWAWTGALGTLCFAAALFPALGTPARVLERFPNAHPPIGTLDGMAFMTVGVYTWPNEDYPISLHGDYEAIRWLRDNVQGTPVLAEAPIGYYREFGVRAASYTGLPTLLGMHEAEQRYDWQVGPRSGLANELFMSGDLQRTMELIKELRIQYVYIGPLERTQYPHSVDKFEQLASRKFLSSVYQNDLVTIYRVER